ncbi:MAG: TetR/AcrR family transcriptional regulator, partial [Anaerolineales bacterium]|nr:TetR/AcrR family transcriptional regulator [Anaerolineales bacterium]
MAITMVMVNQERKHIPDTPSLHIIVIPTSRFNYLIRMYMDRNNTKEIILAAARKCIAEKGYEACSVNHICKEAKLSKGAFYHHFESKSELLTAVVENFVKEINIGITKSAILDQVPVRDQLEKMAADFDQALFTNIDKDGLKILVEYWFWGQNISGNKDNSISSYEYY